LLDQGASLVIGPIAPWKEYTVTWIDLDALAIVTAKEAHNNKKNYSKTTPKIKLK